MSDLAWKRLGMILMLGAVILAAVAIKMNHDQKQWREEQRAQMKALIEEGHPMGGRVATAWEDPGSLPSLLIASGAAPGGLLILAIFSFSMPRFKSRPVDWQSRIARKPDAQG